MYDALSGRYTFACPAREHTTVPLSAFRQVERLPGATHPAVYRVRFACACGEEHDGLVPHDELDWAPLGVREERAFLNLMTDRLEPAGEELSDLAARMIGAGHWPWSFFCYGEDRPRPVFPSMFCLLAPGAQTGLLGLAARCPSCNGLSINIVSSQHVDVPFHNDSQVGVVDHVFAEDALRTVEAFQAELWSASFDARRLQLD
jgi:hypothetical protein